MFERYLCVNPFRCCDHSIRYGKTPHPAGVSAARTNPVLHVLGWDETLNSPNSVTASGEHTESTTLSLPPWFFLPGSLTSPLQPSWQVQGCIKHVFTLWKASCGSLEYFSSDFLYFCISFDCQFSCTHPSGLSQDVICAAILGCWGCCDSALKENSPVGSAQPTRRCQEGKNKRSQDWTVSWLCLRGHKRDAQQGEKPLLAECGLEECFPEVLPLESSLTGRDGWLWPSSSGCRWYICFWISSSC